jgi:membrane protease YdiL (CAAX protease family)
MALLEVLLCSGFPTQLALILLLTVGGNVPPDGALSLSYVVRLSLLDAALVLGLIWVFLRLRGEDPIAIFVGRRPLGREANLGLLLVPAALVLVAATSAIVLKLAPWLHNVAQNPLEAMINSPAAAATFALVAVVAGGIREEVQRAFVLRRFETHLGGPVLGLVVFSIAFGLGHLVQGRDAALITGLLGAFWGVIYLKRRSIVAPVICHSGFNLVEVLIAYNLTSAVAL